MTARENLAYPLGRPAAQLIDLMGVWPDQNAPLVGLDTIEDESSPLRRRWNLREEM